MSYSEGPRDWGIVARSFFWFVQAGALSGIALLSLGVRGDDGSAPLVIALVASFLSILLLFRQINALVDRKLERRD